MTLLIVLGVLLLLSVYALLAHTTTRLSFLEKQPEIIDFIEVYTIRDSLKRYPRYKPVVKFEVNGKFYQGTAHVHPTWQTKEKRPLTILYNPKNPSEFVVKESSTSPVTGCGFMIIVLIVLSIAIYFYFRS